MIDMVRLGEDKDRVQWSIEARGKFSTKSNWQPQKYNLSWLLLYGNSSVLRRFNFFSVWWPTEVSILRENSVIGTLSPSACCLCLKSNETLFNLFLHYLIASSGLFFLMDIFDFINCLPKSIDNWLVEVLSICQWSKHAQILWKRGARAL